MARLLLIEDNQHIQRIYVQKFRHAGFEVVTADNGEEGLEKVVSSQPDVILLDIMLPRLSGFEVLKRLQGDATLSKIPVFMLSNKAWPDDVQCALSLGARQFYAKGSSSLQDIIIQIRTDHALKQISIVSHPQESAHEIAALLRG